MVKLHGYIVIAEDQWPVFNRIELDDFEETARDDHGNSVIWFNATWEQVYTLQPHFTVHLRKLK